MTTNVDMNFRLQLEKAKFGFQMVNTNLLIFFFYLDITNIFSVSFSPGTKINDGKQKK